MIYFAQDETVNLIKIGFTDGPDAEARLRALQTGSPIGLVLLCTMPGDRAKEKELHERFAAYRERGEWFRPAPALISFLVALNSKTEKCLDAVPWPLRIYLAGKVAGAFWRHEIVDGLFPYSAQLDEIQLVNEPWPVMHEAIFGVHHFVGPYCWNPAFHPVNGPNEDDHGVGLATMESSVSGSHCPEQDVIARCLEAIRKSDVVFAWVDSLDCYGTIAELGYAIAMKKLVYVAGPKRFRDMWFVYKLCTSGTVDMALAFSAKEAMRRFLDDYYSYMTKAK